MKSSGTNMKRPPGRPKAGEGDLSMRATILNTASVLFMELGYEPVSINMIAEKSGVTKASVYYYFNNKASLFTTSVTEMMNRICFYTNQIINQDTDIRTKLERIAVNKLARTHVDFESMMSEAIPFLELEQQDEIRKAEHRIHDVLAQAFESAMREGHIAKGNPMLLSHVFASLLMVGNRQNETVNEFASDELAQTIVALFWDGIGPK
ncbi:MAG: TetR/AcrR family transcriptional regulator [Candidatus Cohnella colombiensis]|uniref:TetR/AcrR family transcriptional regulator n=1 Tax=Candidatus Cohnella colombiensis TaxID=3121368 RepID=A0AA95ETE1_9BACL|nr:MAG: TetR/AcrR family transcriptional regulator [Cohnella sp.]